MTLFIAATLCAYFIKGICGFANTLIFSSILSFGADNINISPVDLILGFPSNVILTWRNRKNLEWRVWAPLSALVLLGNIPGILLLKNVDATPIKILFGAVVVGIGAEMMYREYCLHDQDSKVEWKSKKSKTVLAFIGLVSGMLCGLYGVGALLAAYMSRVTNSTQAFKANICAVFITENVFRVIIYSMTGILTLQVFCRAAFLVPAMLIGLWLGMKCAGRLNELVVKKFVVIVLILSGLSLIIANLL